MSGETLLEARQIGRRAGDGTWLLRDVSLNVSAGERWGIAGPTGSGKTLLLRALALLDAVQEGSIRWQGRAISDNAVPAFRRQVIYLHQRPVLVEATVEVNLQLPFQLRGVRGVRGDEGRDRWSRLSKEFDRAAIVNLLASLGREESFLAKASGDLSGGEAQIVALLRALQLNPTVLLLDEPTAALDAESRTAIETLVEQWFTDGVAHPESGKGVDSSRKGAPRPSFQSGRATPPTRSIVWVSHDPEQLRRVTEKTLRLQHGRVQE